MTRLHRVRWAEALEGLLDDELGARRVARVLEHLEECPDCLGELEELVRLQRSLARLAVAEALPSTGSEVGTAFTDTRHR